MFVRCAFVSAALLGAVVSGTPSAAAADHSSMTSAAPISSAPFASTEATDRTPQPPSTGVGNLAVANACNSGQPIYGSHWWRFTPSTTTTVVARSHVLHQIGRTAIDDASGIAIVNATGAVLNCATNDGLSETAPRAVEAGTSLYVVQFHPEDPSCGPDHPFICYDMWRLLALKPTTGVPPTNDNWESAAQIASLPSTQSVDATMATEQEPDMSGDYPDCVNGMAYQETARSVWWSYTPSTTGPVLLTLNGALVHRDQLLHDGEPRAIIARLTPTGPDFSDYCNEEQYPPLQAGVTYLFHVGYPISNYYFRDHVDAGGPVTLSVAAAKLPTTPTGLTVSDDYAARSATISWMPPSADDGPPVTGYRVARDGTDSGGGGPWSTSLPATARSQTFTLLNPGVTYTLTIQAINAVGTGPIASVPVSLAPATAATPGGQPDPVVSVVAAPVAAITPTAPAPTPAVGVVAPPSPPSVVLRPPLNRAVRITKVQYNARGRDTRRNLNGEYVTLRNTGSRAVVLTGWTIRDAAGSTYTFRSTRLRAGGTITLFTGKGTATTTKRYWSRKSHIWNNVGRESARLRDSFGRAVDGCAWTSRRTGYTSC